MQNVSRPKKLLFGLAFSLCLFAMLELILWVGGVPTVIEREDPFRGFSGLLSVYQREGDVYRTRRAVVGSTFNDQSFLADKPANGVRMFCLGGSSSYGYPWGAEAAFLSIAGEAAAANHPELRVEAINASGISYAMHRMNIVADELLSYKPDVFVVYEGHNEFIEPAFFDALKRRSPSRNRLEYLVAHSRVFSSMWFLRERLESRRPSVPKEVNAVVERDQTRTFSREEKGVIVAEFRWRLERLVTRAQAAGVKVLLATVPCNLRWRPEGSLMGGLSDKNRLNWEGAFFSGKNKLNAHDFAGACMNLELAVRLAPGHAETQYLLGQAYEGVSRWDDARLAYQRACDADAKPIRRLSGVNEVIRAVAREHDALLVDVDKIFEERSEHGLVGFNLIEDYVHPTREGHELIAWHMWEAMEQAGWFKRGAPAQRVVFDRLVAERRKKLSGTENATWIRNQAFILQNQGRIREAMEKYRECLAKAPEDQAALQNFGGLLDETGRSAEAVEVLERLVAINSRNFVACNNLGNALLHVDKVTEAIRSYEQALQIQPDYAQGHANLGSALTRAGKLPEAIGHIEQALRIEPNSALAHNYFGLALLQGGKVPEAIGHFEQALRIQPASDEVHFNLARALAATGRLPEAIGHLEQALKIRPNHPLVHHSLGLAFLQTGKVPEAIKHFEEALRIKPGLAEAHYALAVALEKVGKFQEAIGHYTEAVRLRPDLLLALNNLAWIRATNADSKLRDGAEAVRLAEHACQLTGRKQASCLDTLAVAYAEAGRFQEALATAEEAVALARAAKQSAADEIQSRLELYRAGKPYREPVRGE